MSKTKAGGSKASQHISPAGKRLGPKVSDGESVEPGVVLVRQIGTRIKGGAGVATGRDQTLLSLISGKVKYGRKLGRIVVSVVSK